MTRGRRPDGLRVSIIYIRLSPLKSSLKMKPPHARYAWDGFLIVRRAGLFQVLADELGHLEHVDRALAAENGLEGGVGVDVALVLAVLQLVLLDVHPELLDDLGARQRLAADDFGELGAGGQSLHEGGVCFGHVIDSLLD